MEILFGWYNLICQETEFIKLIQYKYFNVSFEGLLLNLDESKSSIITLFYRSILDYYNFEVQPKMLSHGYRDNENDLNKQSKISS